MALGRACGAGRPAQLTIRVQLCISTSEDSDVLIPEGAPMKPGENGFTREDLKAKLFQGFADPLRTAILELLRQREMCVGEIAEAIGCAQPRISNHLACLRWCQFVQTRKEGNQVIYSLGDDRIRK